MRKSILPLLFATTLLMGCANETPSSSSNENTPSSETTTGDGKTLVAFFSATGTTRKIGNMISSHLGATTFEIQPADPYTSSDLNYNNSSSRVSTEHNDPNRHVELVSDSPEDFESYSTIFIGYPIWWGIAAWPVDDFVKNNDFSGKTVVPFATAASSGMGNSVSLLKEMNNTGNWLEGKMFRSSSSENDVASWVDSLNL